MIFEQEKHRNPECKRVIWEKNEKEKKKGPKVGQRCVLGEVRDGGEDVAMWRYAVQWRQGNNGFGKK